jgi:hypothetical protein
MGMPVVNVDRNFLGVGGDEQMTNLWVRCRYFNPKHTSIDTFLRIGPNELGFSAALQEVRFDRLARKSA